MIQKQAETLSNEMVNFANKKHQFKEHAETIFNEKADALQKMSTSNKERIKRATNVFDQKIKDKMIDMDSVSQR